MVTRLDTICV